MSNQKEEEGTASASAETSEKDSQKIYGDYEILKAIGKGKFAVVYRAQRISDGQIVALKRISVDMIDDKARDKCLKEVGLLQSLDHPNIIKYLDSFINENHLVIIVEWAAAGDLKRQLRKAQERETGFDERIIWKYFSQIADAIQHMHERRIMHRDLKPANIFLTLDGTVKVGDLGLSRELSENTYQAHSKVGTPLYMSPEVLRGDGYDFKSDIWSIGCLLYELAMLKSPFKSEGLNLYSLFQKISQGEYSPLPDRYSEALRRLTYAMISTNPEDRPDITDICLEARAMRVQCHEEYIKRKQQEQQEKDGEEESSSVRGRAQETKDGRGMDDSPRSTVSKTTINSTTSRSPAEDGPSPSVGRGSVASRKREVDSEGSGDEDKGSRVGSRGGGRGSRTNSGRRRNDADDEDSTNTEDTRSNVRVAGKTPPKKDVQRDPPRAALNSKGQQKPGDSNGRGVSGAGHSHSTPSKPSTLRPNRSPSSIPDNDATFIPYTKARARTDGSSSPPKPQQPVVQKRRKEPTSGASSLTTRAADNGHDALPSRKVADNRGMQLNFDDELPLDEGGDSVNGGTVKMGSRASKMSTAGAAFAMMDIVYAKLIALGYPMYTDSEYGGNSGGRCKISPVHFASDSVSLFGRQSRSAFPATQFGSFVEVSSWLVGVANGTDSQPVNIDVDSDPPATIVRQLLRFAQECGVSATTLAEVTPTSLQQGHGEKVCVFLNLLCDAAIHRLDYKWKPFEYPPDDVACPPNMTTDDDEDDIIEEYLGDGEDYTAAQSPDFEVSGTAAGNLHMSMIIGMADSYKWQEETERVAASLKSKMNSIGKGSSWVTHVGMLREYGAKILGPSLVTTEKNSSAASMDISSANMLDMISSLQHSLLADLSGIARVEKMINTNPDLCRMGMSYANIKQELDSLEERSSSGSKKTIAGSEKLAEIQDTLNELTDQLEAKTGDGGDGDGSSAAVKLKRAIKSIKEEVREMSLRTAMLQTEILAVKKMDINMKRKSASRKQKARSRRNRKVKASTPLEDEYSV